MPLEEMIRWIALYQIEEAERKREEQRAEMKAKMKQRTRGR